MRILEGGCTAPIGALAELFENQIQFKGVLFSLDGKTKFEILKSISVTNFKGFVKNCALSILANGGEELMEKIKNETGK